jgi:ankyrin repeat protein
MKTIGDEQTPLHFAAKMGNKKSAKFLIEVCKANKEPKDYLKRTPLYVAAEFGWYSWLNTIKEHSIKIIMSNIESLYE